VFDGSAPGPLVEAAREVFAERGYDATTREIASRAGASHDLIFRYVDSKEQFSSMPWSSKPEMPTRAMATRGVWSSTARPSTSRGG